MMSEASLEYARRLAKKYNVSLPTSILDEVKNLETIGEVAIRVLPQKELDEWYKAQKQENRQLRKKFGLVPFDHPDDKEKLISKRV
jgi:hypothetical protein